MPPVEVTRKNCPAMMLIVFAGLYCQLEPVCRAVCHVDSLSAGTHAITWYFPPDEVEEEELLEEDELELELLEELEELELDEELTPDVTVTEMELPAVEPKLLISLVV
jgi:hypothetical protein